MQQCLFKKAQNINPQGTTENLQMITNKMRFFEFVSSGKDENTEKIIHYLKHDPNRNLYDKDQRQNYFVNQKNYEGSTALYVSCLNGFITITDVLLQWDGDPFIKCGNKNEEESILDVSVRWGHIKLIEYLLHVIQWPFDYLKEATKVALAGKNETIIKMLRKATNDCKKNAKKQDGCFSCFN